MNEEIEKILADLQSVGVASSRVDHVLVRKALAKAYAAGFIQAGMQLSSTLLQDNLAIKEELKRFLLG